MSRLEESIDQLYVAFADIPKPRHIDGCPCCMTDDELNVLLSRNLKQITPQELSPYAMHALLTVGSVPDYLYFLPRILHITATDDSWWPAPEVTGRAIHSTEPQNWPDARINALESFLAAVVRASLAPDRHHMIDSWLCAIALMGIDVQPHLNAIEQSTDAVLAYFNDNASDIPHRRLRNGFWKLPCGGHDKIVNWFHSAKVRHILFNAYGFVMP